MIDYLERWFLKQTFWIRKKKISHKKWSKKNVNIILISGALYILISILWVVFSALPSDLKPSQFVMMSTMLKYTRLQMLSFLFQKTILIHELPMYEDSIICELKKIAKIGSSQKLQDMQYAMQKTLNGNQFNYALWSDN